MVVKCIEANHCRVCVTETSKQISKKCVRSANGEAPSPYTVHCRTVLNTFRQERSSPYAYAFACSRGRYAPMARSPTGHTHGRSCLPIIRRLPNAAALAASPHHNGPARQRRCQPECCVFTTESRSSNTVRHPPGANNVISGCPTTPLTATPGQKPYWPSAKAGHAPVKLARHSRRSRAHNGHRSQPSTAECAGCCMVAVKAALCCQQNEEAARRWCRQGAAASNIRMSSATAWSMPLPLKPNGCRTTSVGSNTTLRLSSSSGLHIVVAAYQQ